MLSQSWNMCFFQSLIGILIFLREQDRLLCLSQIAFIHLLQTHSVHNQNVNSYLSCWKTPIHDECAEKISLPYLWCLVSWIIDTITYQCQYIIMGNTGGFLFLLFLIWPLHLQWEFQLLRVACLLESWVHWTYLLWYLRVPPFQQPEFYASKFNSPMKFQKTKA